MKTQHARSGRSGKPPLLLAGRPLPPHALVFAPAPYNEPILSTGLAPPQGPSGSGKTTLLNLLAGRSSAGKMTGEVLFAGIKPTLPFLRRHTGYVSALRTRVYVGRGDARWEAPDQAATAVQMLLP